MDGGWARGRAAHASQRPLADYRAAAQGSVLSRGNEVR
jgi:hypothetical protein